MNRSLNNLKAVSEVPANESRTSLLGFLNNGGLELVAGILLLVCSFYFFTATKKLCEVETSAESTLESCELSLTQTADMYANIQQKQMADISKQLITFGEKLDPVGRNFLGKKAPEFFKDVGHIFKEIRENGGKVFDGSRHFCKNIEAKCAESETEVLDLSKSVLDAARDIKRTGEDIQKLSVGKEGKQHLDSLNKAKNTIHTAKESLSDHTISKIRIALFAFLTVISSFHFIHGLLKILAYVKQEILR